MPDRTTVHGLCGALLLIFTFGLAIAQADETPAKDIDSVRSEKARVEAEARKLRSDAEALRAEITELSRDMKERAAAVRAGEAALDDLDRRAAALEVRIAELQHSLSARRDEMAQVFSALAGISRVPPLAIIARPGDAADARLAASALAGLKPGLEKRATALRAEMSELSGSQMRLADLRAETVAGLTAQRERRAELAVLMDRKKQLAGQVESRARKAGARAVDLAKQVETLTALMRKLDEIEPVAAPAAAATPVRFASMRGRLALPAEGRIRSRFGEQRGVNDGSGMVLSTRPGALVTAPHDAIVRFAGPFRSYGELLILDFGEGYHLLVAGLSGIDVVVGQWLLAGEPVGLMSNGNSAGRPELYLELRRDGSPINPGPWLAKK
ncbi:murein hydrolase activator EnvC family protein [Minwuia sp.]|uniref:murein hydrolase activator EnvC family protein n=1 Tax=Minwuia sp. TaxID=2493630 RepID=UPI003A91438B